MVPDVDADAAVGPPGLLDDRPGVVHAVDVGEGQELEPDDEAVVGGPVAQRPEGLRGLGHRSLGRSDGLQVAAAELVGHPPGDVLPLGGGSPPMPSRTEPRDDLDLGQHDVVLVEQVAQPPRRLALRLEGAVVVDVEADGGEAVGRGEGDALVDRVDAAEAEVAEDEVVPPNW